MSHFTTLKTQLVDAEALLKALSDLGFKNVERHDTPQSLQGYRGDWRSQQAHLIIRRKYVGAASNDIGFLRSDDGSFDAIISEYDRRKYSPQWLDGLTQRYAYHVTRARLATQGFDLIAEETQPDGRIHLVLRRMA